MPETTKTTKSTETYKSEVPVTWCPGCGDFSVLHALYKALGVLGYDTKDTVIASGIGLGNPG